MTKNKQKLTKTLPNNYEGERDDNTTLNNYKEAQNDYRQANNCRGTYGGYKETQKGNSERQTICKHEGLHETATKTHTVTTKRCERTIKRREVTPERAARPGSGSGADVIFIRSLENRTRLWAFKRRTRLILEIKPCCDLITPV